MNRYISSLQEKRNRWVITSKENDFEEGITNLLTELYPDNAHFIYELLQNAEDADAKKVTFYLESDKLVFTHDGKKLFNEKDIEAITNIGKGTKKDDINKIGKFGIGFKSVFSYTQTPIIHSGDFSFQIHNLVVPQEVESIPKQSNETVFIFPFNNFNKTADKAHEEIKTGLININRTTLLFLNSIREIDISISNNRFSITKKHDKQTKITTIVNTKAKKESNFLVFSKSLPNDPKLYVAIAFLMIHDKNTNELKTEIEHYATVSIYFPAEKETSNLKFHIHAPFASTVARDSITDRKENHELIALIAELLCEATDWVKTNGLLNDNFLRCLPNEDDNLAPFYKPIQLRTIEHFNTGPYILCDDNEYHNAEDCWQSTSRLKSTINSTDLKILFKDKIANECYWVKRSLQKNLGDRANKFYKLLNIQIVSEDYFEEHLLSICDSYIEHPKNLRSELKKWKETHGWRNPKLTMKISELLSSKILTEGVIFQLSDYIETHHISDYSVGFLKSIIQQHSSHQIISEFLKNKNNDWLILFYDLLFDIILSRLDEYDNEYTDDGIVGDYKGLRVFIKLESGNFNLTKSECYFPSETRLSSIKSFFIHSETFKETINNKPSKSKRFLKYALGVKDIDMVSEVQHALRKYSEDDQIKPSDNIDHIKLFIQFFIEQGKSFDQKQFRNVQFIINSDNELCLPESILVDTPLEKTSLQLFINDEYKLLHDIYTKAENNIDKSNLSRFLRAIGCWFTIPIVKVNNDYNIKLKLGSYARETEYGVNENYRFEIIQPFEIPELKTSKIIWDYFISLNDSKYFTATYRANGTSETKTCDSDVIETMKTNAWIPDKDGNFCKPGNIIVKDLHPDFKFNDKNNWLTKIGLRESHLSDQDLEVVEEKIQGLTGYSLEVICKLRDAGYTEDDLNKLSVQNKHQIEPNLKEGIREHNRSSINNNEPINLDKVINEDKYREKIQKQLTRNLSSAKIQTKIYNYSKVVKVGKTETTDFLRKQYTGHCQICGFTFSQSQKRGNYFELFDWLSEKTSHQKSNIIDAGSSLCLCSRCHSILKFGDFNADFLSEIEEDQSLDYAGFAEKFNLLADNADIPEIFKFIEKDMYKLPIRKLNKDEYIYFTEEHFIHFHNLLTLSKKSDELNDSLGKTQDNVVIEEGEVDSKISINSDVISNGASEPDTIITLDDRKIAIGDLITVKFFDKNESFKLRLVDRNNRIHRDHFGHNTLPVSSPFGSRLVGRSIGYTFVIGSGTVEILNIE